MNERPDPEGFGLFYLEKEGSALTGERMFFIMVLEIIAANPLSVRRGI